MAHEVETMAYVNQGAGDNPWWNRDGLRGNADGTVAIGHPVTNDMSPEEIAVAAGIDWTVDKLPVFNQWDGNFMQVPDRYNLTRMSDGRVLDVVGKLFKCTQNLDAVRFFSDFVKAGDMTMNTCGSLRGGQRIWALAKINEGFTLVGGDRVEGYLLLSLPHKQGEAITVKLTKVRVVCRNTEIAALNGWGSAWRMSHVHEFDGDMQQAAKEALGLAKQKVQEDALVAGMLSETRIREQEKLIEYVAKVSGSELLEDIIDQTEQSAMDSRDILDAAISATNSATLARAFRTTDLNAVGRKVLESILTSPGSDMPSARGTWWGALNGVTHATDHVLGKESDTRFDSAWFGPRAALKTKAAEMAVQYAKAVAA